MHAAPRCPGASARTGSTSSRAPASSPRRWAIAASPSRARTSSTRGGLAAAPPSWPQALPRSRSRSTASSVVKSPERCAARSSAEDQRVLGGQRPRQLGGRGHVLAQLGGPPLVHGEEAAQRLDARLGLRRALGGAAGGRQLVVLPPQPRQEPELLRVEQIALLAGGGEDAERPARQGRVVHLVVGEHHELAQGGRARRRRLALPSPSAADRHADERLGEGGGIVEGGGVVAQGGVGGDAGGIARQGLDPGLDGAIRAGQGPGAELGERLVGLAARAAREPLGPRLQADRQELVEPRQRERLVHPRRVVALDLALEPGVEHRAHRPRRVALRERRQHPPAMGGDGGRGPL